MYKYDILPFCTSELPVQNTLFSKSSSEDSFTNLSNSCLYIPSKLNRQIVGKSLFFFTENNNPCKNWKKKKIKLDRQNQSELAPSEMEEITGKTSLLCSLEEGSSLIF